MRADQVTRDEFHATTASLVTRDEFHAAIGNLVTREEFQAFAAATARGFAEVAAGMSELALQMAGEFAEIRREMSAH